MKRLLPSVAALSVTLLLASALTFLGLQSPALAAGDVETGKVLADTCMGCHGIRGYQNTYPAYHVPRLRGQHAKYIIAALKAYKSGERSHKTMRAQAASLSEQDMADLAAYFSGAGVDD